MSERFKVDEKVADDMYSYIFDNDIKLCLCDVVDLLNSFSDVVLAYDKRVAELRKENEQLKVLLKEAEDEIERLKKTKQGLLESIAENDSNNAMILEFISNVRESEMCEGCKHKDKPVEWYLENGLSITNGVCNRYEPED